MIKTTPKAFATARAFEAWMKKHHAKCDEVWIRFFKKASGKKTVVYAEALDVALCYGWIDGLVNSIDQNSYKQRFTPRRPKSGWSKRNTEHVTRLIREGRMKPPGLLQVEAAKRDGRWAAAYESPKNAKPPADFLNALSKDRKAASFFKTLNKTNLFAICYRLQTAKKPETRERRMKKILSILRAGQKITP